MPTLNLIGQKFGELTVIKKSEQKKNNRVAWECLCSCGNMTTVITNHLTSGHTKSCGCLQKKVASQMNPAVDITNQRFGKLVAIEKTSSKGKHTYWKCKCDCGNYCEVRTNSLKSGHTQSCGCITSVGEEQIEKWLKLHNIPFERQKTFNSCRNPKTNTLLKFDFFINDKFLLEYDGITHFRATNGWNDQTAVNNIQQHDNIKNIWANENNIKLYRISYNEIYSNNKLETILTQILQEESAF